MKNIFASLKNRIQTNLEKNARFNHVLSSVVHVRGPKHINLHDNEIAVIAVGRNMSYYLDYFYDYHKKIGATHFLYLDNGSTDDSLVKLSKWENSIIIKSDVNFKDYQAELRQIATKAFIGNGWRLAIDPDELFEYPNSENITLPQLTAILSENNYTGLAAQMLDLVPKGPVAHLKDKKFSEIVKSHTYYQTTNVDVFEYQSSEVPFSGLIRGNKLSEPPVHWKYGGIRKTHFGEFCCLTKHPLFYLDQKVKPFVHPHLTTGLKLADFTVVLKHYKFAGSFAERESLYLKQDRISHNETALRARYFNETPEFSFDLSDCRNNPTVEDLLDQKFIQMSDRAKRIFF